MLVPQGEGTYRRFALLQFTMRVLNLGDFKFIPLYKGFSCRSRWHGRAGLRAMFLHVRRLLFLLAVNPTAVAHYFRRDLFQPPALRKLLA